MAIANKFSTGRLVLASAVALTSFSLIISGAAFAAQPKVELGNAESFAVLGGSAITNTGPTTVSGTAGGDMGSSPTVAFTGEADVTTTGTKYTAAATAVDDAKTDLVLAYDDAAGRIPVNTVSADLGGQTLAPGVYNSAQQLS